MTNPWISLTVTVLTVVLAAVISHKIAKHFLNKLLGIISAKTKTQLDDMLLKHNFFTWIASFAPAIILYRSLPFMVDKVHIFGYTIVSLKTVALLTTLLTIWMQIAGFIAIQCLLTALNAYYKTFKISRKVPLTAFVQVAKFILWIIFAVVTISTLRGKSSVVFFTGLGTFTAVLMLVFKDSILGLVAGITLISNNMIHIGDWIEMPKHNADGDVIEVNLTCVKVQNFDKTIVTIPAYSLVSDSFRNWRGMSESNGRRIKRAVNIDIRTIKFCDEQMLQKFHKFECLAEYIHKKENEISEFNRSNKIDDSVMVNGRRLTNIGTFRAYVIEYLKKHPQINKEMTFLVRQLAPNEKGLPIEIYVFCKDKIWANYEAIMADIFDHILAVVPEFGLSVYQMPSGNDLSMLNFK